MERTVKKKLIYVAIFLIFTLLTGGIQYHFIIWEDIGLSYGYTEEVRIFGFYHKKYCPKLGERVEVSYGWGFFPSLKIFSINNEKKLKLRERR